MRPDRPGNWWWQCTAGYQHAVEVSMDIEVPGHIVSDGRVSMESITEFEHGQYFDKWLGPAHPPKTDIVKAYDILNQAVIDYLVYNGPCEDADDPDDGMCENDDCAYCKLINAQNDAEKIAEEE